MLDLDLERLNDLLLGLFRSGEGGADAADQEVVPLLHARIGVARRRRGGRRLAHRLLDLGDVGPHPSDLGGEVVHLVRLVGRLRGLGRIDVDGVSALLPLGRPRRGEHLVEDLAHLHGGGVALVLGDVAVVVRLVEIAPAEGLGALGLGEAPVEIVELGARVGVGAVLHALRELFLARELVLQRRDDPLVPLVLGAIERLLRLLELHVEEGLLVLLPRDPGHELRIDSPPRRRCEEATDGHPHEGIRPLLVSNESRHDGLRC